MRLDKGNITFNSIRGSNKAVIITTDITVAATYPIPNRNINGVHFII
jgi:hypothetical protein